MANKDSPNINKVMDENIGDFKYNASFKFDSGRFVSGEVGISEADFRNDLIKYFMETHEGFLNVKQINFYRGDEEKKVVDKALELIEKTADEVGCSSVLVSLVKKEKDKEEMLGEYVFNTCLDREYVATKGRFLEKKLK